MRVKVKICGNTNLNDSLAAITFGADAVGFLVGQVHASTGHFLTPEQVAEIVMDLPPHCSTVLVTHLSKPKEIIDAAKRSNVNTIQLHGDISPAEAEEIKKALPYIKAYKVIHVIDGSSIAEAKTYEGTVDAIILDSANRQTGQVGGTGQTHDWSISKKLVEAVKLPVILAGGLNPDNVSEAIRVVKPYAVDVHSGVKNPDNMKDLVKLKAFIENAKNSIIS